MELNLDNTSGINDHLISLGWLDAGNSVTALSIAGAGNMNLTLRASCTSGSLILKQSRSYVAKYPDIPAPIERLDVEAGFYHAVLVHPRVAVAMPQLIGYDAVNHLLALEDLGTSSDFSAAYGSESDGPTALPVQPLLSWLGQLHQIRPGDVPDASQFANLAMRELNHAHIFAIPLQADNGLELPEQRASIAARFQADSRLKARAEELGAIYLADAGSQASLLHGDFYPGSWLSTDRGIRIIDVEFAFFGAREFDLGVFVAHSIMTGATPEQAHDSLQHYPQHADCDSALITAFAGIEVIRRLLGVAQLPITAPEVQQVDWLNWAFDKVCQ